MNHVTIKKTDSHKKIALEMQQKSDSLLNSLLLMQKLVKEQPLN